MNKNVLIVLFGGFLIAVIVAVLVQASLSGGKKESAPVVKQEVEEVHVLVAARDLKTGTVLGEDDMRWQSWPEESVFGGAVVQAGGEDPLDAIGGRLSRSVRQGEPVMKSAVVADEGNFVAASLKPGMRAVAFDVKAATMVGGFVTPGDSVDILLTYSKRIELGANDLARQMVDRNIDRYATETLLQNIKVLAIDQKPTRDEEGKVKVAKTVTVEVSPHDAEKLVLADEMGDLTLALRGIGDDSIVASKWLTVTDARITRIFNEVFSQYTRVQRETSSGTQARNVRIYNGDSVNTVAAR